MDCPKACGTGMTAGALLVCVCVCVECHACDSTAYCLNSSDRMEDILGCPDSLRGSLQQLFFCSCFNLLLQFPMCQWSQPKHVSLPPSPGAPLG